VRSPLGSLFRNKVPIKYTSSALSLPFMQRNDAESQMRAMGSVGTLFSIVNRTSTATAEVKWNLYRKRVRSSNSAKKGERVEVGRHAAIDLWNKPNPFYTRQLLVESSQQHLDLVGEAWWVIYWSKRFKVPLELWPVRPDRMEPVPHPTEFLSGYVYTSPGGERVPLDVNEVIQIRMPNPLDPYRGMGPVQAILADLDAVKYSAEWNRNFFINSAEPGGLIKVPDRLSDDEFRDMRNRWQEQHQGVARAHRVAILENAEWVDRSFSQRDMQFVELRNVSREVIREAFGIHGHVLGVAEDINRANALAANETFAQFIVRSRLARFADTLNSRLLALYGPTGEDLEWDHENPTPADREADDRERESKANAFSTLVAARVEPEDAAAFCEMPQMRMAEPEPVPVLTPDSDPDPEPDNEPELALAGVG